MSQSKRQRLEHDDHAEPDGSAAPTLKHQLSISKQLLNDWQNLDVGEIFSAKRYNLPARSAYVDPLLNLEIELMRRRENDL